MRTRLIAALFAALSFCVHNAVAQGIKEARVLAPAPSRQIRIAIPVEIKNFPRTFSTGGSPAAQVQCVLLEPQWSQIGPALMPYGQPVVVPVPFDPGQGKDSYQGTVSVVLTVPGGMQQFAMQPAWTCSISAAVLGQGAQLDQSASVLNVRGSISP